MQEGRAVSSVIRTDIESWGRWPRAKHLVFNQAWRSEGLPVLPQGVWMLPFGMGRSYGDSCLNDGNALLLTRPLNHLMRFDGSTGILTCEAGITLNEILDFSVPRHWFL